MLMTSTLKLWIICSLFCLDCYGQQNLTESVNDLAEKLATAFKHLKDTMNRANADEKFPNMNNEPLNDESIKNILRSSKSDTEEIIKKTNNVVNTIQSKLTKAFQDYSQTPAKKYKLECALNESFIYYYRAKALKDNSNAELKTCGQQYLSLEKDPFLGNILTNRETATAHVPTNVYDASQDIQAVANWTADLDQTFQLKKDDSQLKWQFFCSNTGLFKIYPGIRWSLQIEDSEKDSSLVDFFDCRSEQWYLEATAYPKKMMIMVDKSGSMKGRRRIIANHTIYEILNTLTENDFFNILLFTKEYFFADNTTSGILMQATDKNKKYILDQLGTVFNPDGIAEYDFGLNESFKVLRNDKSNDIYSNLYNYLLMIITDGSPLDYQQLIEYHNKEIKARIFTYLIGQGTTEREMVTNMACKNRGYAVEIATLADVKENVQKYLNVVARKNALLRNSFNVWTGIHKMQMQPTEEALPINNTDATIMPPILNPSSIGVTFAPNITSTFATSTTKNFQSNGSMPTQPTQTTKIEIFEDKPIDLFVTASKAIFDETNATAQWKSGILLGAAGVDVPISEFIKTAPFWKIGVNAYLFGITSNGFVLFHPKYAPQYKKHIKYFYRNVDISELEIDSNTIQNMTFIRNDQIVQTNGSFQLRKEMLDQSPNLEIKRAGTLSTYQLVDDFKTAFNVTRKYFITGINNTSYKFGLAVPVDQKVPLYTKEKFEPISKTKFYEDFQEDLEKLKNNCKTIFTHKNGTGFTMKNHEFCHMNHYIATLQMKGPMCVLIEVLTNSTTFNDCVANKSSRSEYLNNIYMEMKATVGLPSFWKTINDSNIQQFFSMHHFGLIRYYNYDTLSYQHFIANHSLGIDDPLYQETLLVAEHKNEDGVLVARPLPNEVVKKNIAQSSLVFTVTTPIMNNKMYVGIMGVQAKYNDFLSILIDNTICSDKHKRECFVITESGLILLNNQDIRHNGDLLNEIDCALMESLVKYNIFKQQAVYDFQALCPNQSKQADSFSTRLLNPFTQMFRLSLWLIYELLIMIQNFSLTSLMWSLTAQDGNYNPFAESLTDIQVLSTDSSAHKSISNIIPSGESPKNTQTESKSKRQHELDVKNMLKGEIQLCTNNHHTNENEWSGCIQKAVSNICRQDKNHAPPSDQHVDKLTPLNKISHCETACTILRSEYPKVWQEQDDCKLPQKLCHKFMPTFTNMFPLSIMMPTLSSKQVDNEELYNDERAKIIQNHYSIEGNPPPPEKKRNGTLCIDFCPFKTWYVKEIEKTNLLLVVVDKPNACSCDCANGFGKPKELKRIINQSIENPYIVKPTFFLEFVNYTKEENSSVCSDDALKLCTPQRLLMALSVFLAVFMAC